eukprot:GHRQ01003477.1.p1 GENE.GHRQ01003477.1~~GHRQ01003477.1.p1  ORF type:complete len:166 (-),score=20.45 GHRQ01003477.1:1174-1671(-)
MRGSLQYYAHTAALPDICTNQTSRQLYGTCTAALRWQAGLPRGSHKLHAVTLAHSRRCHAVTLAKPQQMTNNITATGSCDFHWHRLLVVIQQMTMPPACHAAEYTVPTEVRSKKESAACWSSQHIACNPAVESHFQRAFCVAACMRAGLQLHSVRAAADCPLSHV